MVDQERVQAVATAAEESTLSEGQVPLTEENSDAMSDEFEFDMETLLDETMPKVESGQIITGKVLKVTNEDVVVDVGSKSEGVIPLSEFLGDG